ncbi:glutathione S-transferase D6-like [Sitophilus oryzae]|uniref:Glutathione S-transferase D6-like n=1 Tax=Sitophilus oryzae TaxID=7048 RepID=A0A6J2YRZ0_SITOR|nr:glutathione S-transferase D6-like [Sitophilus oryzae]
MAPTLYMSEISPPCRAVLMTARILGLTLKVKKMDLGKQEQLSPNFLKQINPQHTIPTLCDNGFVIWDSHAIIAFLVGKYGNDDELYSKDIMERALIDQRLHFDSSVVNNFTRTILVSLLSTTRNIPINILFNDSKLKLKLNSYQSSTMGIGLQVQRETVLERRTYSLLYIQDNTGIRSKETKLKVEKVGQIPPTHSTSHRSSSARE